VRTPAHYVDATAHLQSKGPTGATITRLEHLRGSALGFRNLTNDIVRTLLENGGFGPDAPSIMKSA
jgi:transposase